jgi:hypothetical protein
MVVALVALASCTDRAINTDDSGPGDTGNTPTMGDDGHDGGSPDHGGPDDGGSTTTEAGTGGITSSDVGTGGITNSDVGTDPPDCSPEEDDGTCLACLRENCCDGLLHCLLEEECRCVVECMEAHPDGTDTDGGTEGTSCAEQCNGGGGHWQGFSYCVHGFCWDECG